MKRYFPIALLTLSPLVYICFYIFDDYSILFTALGIYISVMSLFIIAKLLTFKKDSKLVKYIRWNVLIFCLMSFTYTYIKVLSSIFLIVALGIIVVYVAFSIFAVFTVRKQIFINAYVTSDKEYLTKESKNEFIIKILIPDWYRYIPFNLGNVNLNIRYGIKGEKFTNISTSISLEKVLEKELTFKYKGNFKVGATRIVYSDLLNLVRISKSYELSDVKVFPKIRDASYSQNYAHSGTVEAGLQLAKMGEKFNTREYIPGDSLKRLSWKIFAMKQDLYIKDSEMASYVGKRVIFYDNRRISKTEGQLYIDEVLTEVLISLVKTCLINKQEFILMYFTKGNKVQRKEYKLRRFEDIYEELSFIPIVDEITKGQLASVKNHLKIDYTKGEIIFLTSKLDLKVKDLLNKYGRSEANFRVINIVTRLYISKVSARSVMQKLGMKYIEIPIGKSLKEFEGEVLK